MGSRSADRNPLAWQATLGGMQAQAARVAQVCGARDCKAWVSLDVRELLARHRPDYSLWDRDATCPRCGEKGWFMASPGPSTPFRPLLSGPAVAARRRAFLKSFGFSRRDIVRIKAMAESVTQLHGEPALNDLDVPYRVGACMPGDETRLTGQVLGEWDGRVLLYWIMQDRELEHWKRRRPGPRKV